MKVQSHERTIESLEIELQEKETLESRLEALEKHNTQLKEREIEKIREMKPNKRKEMSKRGRKICGGEKTVRTERRRLDGAQKQN